MSFCVNGHSSDGHGTLSRTTVHRADCVWAQRYGDGVKWRCFEILEQAITWARTTDYPLNFCGVCDPCTDPADKLEKQIAELQARLEAI